MEATKYKVRAVKFQGKTKPIVCEKSNKCSALVALTNFLYLRRPEVAANHTLDTVEQNFLTSDIVSCIQKFYRRFYCPSYPRQEEDFVHLARSLHRQISLDPINSACNKFQRTIEYDLFTVLGVSLLHGWVLDPEDQNFKSLAGLPYSSMTVLSDLKTPSTNASDPAKSFMNASKHQITSFGLQQLHDKIAEKGLAVLYAGNECNLLYKHDGDLFTLEMSEDKLNQLPDGMWKKLAVEEDQSFYVTDDFGPTKGQHEEKYKLANEWFMAKLSSFDDDDKKPTRKKNRQKKKSTKALKGTAKDSTPQSIHISDVGQGSSKEAARLPSQLSSEEPSVSPTVAPPTTAEKFLNFLMQFQDQSGALYFESAVKEMICTSFLKLYVPFSLLQNHDGNLAIDIQDGYPRIHNELKQSVAKFIIKYDSSAATEEADLEIQNLPPPPNGTKSFCSLLRRRKWSVPTFCMTALRIILLHLPEIIWPLGT